MLQVRPCNLAKEEIGFVVVGYLFFRVSDDLGLYHSLETQISPKRTIYGRGRIAVDVRNS